MNVEMTEDTPLVDIQSNEEEIIPFIIREVYDWNTSLLSLICREGDIYRLRLFIEYSRQMLSCAQHATEIVDRLDVDTGLSPLHHAARYQQLHICLMLLSNINFRFGVNIKDANDRTPMHSAFRSSNNILKIENQFHIETDFGNKIQDLEIWQEEYSTKIFSFDHPLIYLFAKANGDINARDKYLLTPLHYAVARNNLSGVKQLIKLNADIESQDRQRIRPLHLACKEGYLSIVEYLVEQGTKIDAIDIDHWTPMHYACAKGHLDIIKLINSKEKFSFQKLIQMKTNTNSTCLHLAVQNGNIQLVEYILTKFTYENIKLIINQQSQPFGTPLHIAGKHSTRSDKFLLKFLAKFSDSSMINLLYYHEADPFILNSNQQSPLHIASLSNRLSIVKQLYKLTRTSLLEIKDNHGQTALSVTTDPNIIDQLIVYGAKISSIDNNHMNAIMIAVLTGQIAIVNRLLSAINNNNRLLSILDQVEKQNNRSIFLIAIQTGSIDMCSLLLTHRYIRWDTIDKHQMNAFHIAAENNHYELIQFLCNHIQKSEKLLPRLYINAQNEDGKTSLHIACEYGHRLSIEILLNYGADVFLANHLGQLPFHAALQNGYSQCVDLLIKNSKKNINEFQLSLSRRQSPLITACQYGFIDIVKILISENIGINFDWNKEENPLEIAVKYRQIEILHILLEHPHTEHWLMSINSNKLDYQTPLRDMIRYIPECAQHAFDKLIIKTNEIDLFGEKFERIVYKYKYIDDYFMNNDKLYTKNNHKLYRNHPFIIALDNNHHFLLEHPFAKQLMLHKWKLYRSLFYFSRILPFLLLIILTFYVLIIPAPIPNVSLTKNRSYVSIHWIIIILSSINLLQILLLRGLYISFAQLFGIISYISSITAFIPYKNPTNNIISWQWQLTSFAVLFQWFNLAIILRSVPSFGYSMVMIESILIQILLLLFIMSPLFIGFSISINMIFFHQSSFITITKSLHKISSMILGEFNYEILFFSKSTFIVGTFIFIPFIVIMRIVFINLLLGITVGDKKNSIENARAKANAYWIRELIFIESILASKTWFKSKIREDETIDHYTRESNQNKQQDEDKSLINQSYGIESRKLFDILDILCTQAKQILDYEINLEIMLRQLLSIRKTQNSIGLISNRILTIK